MVGFEVRPPGYAKFLLNILGLINFSLFWGRVVSPAYHTPQLLIFWGLNKRDPPGLHPCLPLPQV
jgi:hypothetical protein